MLGALRVNTFLAIQTVAVLLVAGGLLLRFGQGFLGPHIADLVQSLSDVASGAGIDVMDLSQFDFGKILAGMALTIVLLAVGTGLLSGVGMFGAKQNLFVFTIMVNFVSNDCDCMHFNIAAY